MCNPLLKLCAVGCLLLLTLRQSAPAQKGQTKGVTQPAANLKITLELAPVNLERCLIAIADKYQLSIVCEGYDCPRPLIAKLNTEGKKLVFKDKPLKDAFDELARLFYYTYTQENGTYIFQNRLPHLDDQYRVPAKLRALADQHSGKVTFRHLSQFLTLTEPQVESLEEQHPDFALLRPGQRKNEVAFYAALPADLQKRLDAGQKVKYGELPRAMRVKLRDLLLQRYPTMKDRQIATVVYWLTTDEKGWQRLTMSGNLPPQRSAEEVKRLLNRPAPAPLSGKPSR
jgi:hypothetical protein